MKHKSLVVRSLAREPLGVVLPQDHGLAAQDRVELASLKGLPVISPSRQFAPGFYDHLHMRFKRLGYRLNVVQEVATPGEALFLVSEGFGVAFLKGHDVSEEAHGVIFRRLREPSLVEETGIAYRRGQRSGKVEEFTNLARRAVRRMVDGSGFFHGQQAERDERQLNLF